MTKRLLNFSLILCLVLGTAQLTAQVEVAPLSCYPQFTTAGDMDAAAAGDHTSQPFATWKGAYDYAVANGIMTIDFAPGTYSTSVSGFRTDWGDADGGFVLPAGMTVNGNGALIDNNPVGSSQLCFATLSTGSTVDGFTFEKFSGVPNGGALFVPATADNWTISNCDFFSSNQGTDAVIVNMGAGFTGNITGCNFYGNNNPLGEYPQSPGLPSSSAMAITGDLSSDLNITNTTYSCNFRNVSGGAVQIHDDVHVDFDGCTFSGNEANASVGGAVSIRNGAEVTFNNTNFTCNFNSGGTEWDGGAVSVEGGSSASFTGCNFIGNGTNVVANAQTRYGGAIFATSTSFASRPTINIASCTFEGNGADSRGGALRLKDAIASISNSYFSANTAGSGGGLSAETGYPSVYPRATATYNNFNNNTFTGNTSDEIYTEVDINGTGNNVVGAINTTCVPGPSSSEQFTGNFNNTSDNFYTGVSNWTAGPSTTVVWQNVSGENYMDIDASDFGYVYRDIKNNPLNTTCPYNTVLSANTGVVQFTAAFRNASSLEGFGTGTEDGMGFILAASSSDFTTANGYAVVGDVHGANRISLSYFTGGLSNPNFTEICGVGVGSTNGVTNAFPTRITYNPTTNLWTMELDVDPSSQLMDDPRECIVPEFSVSGTDATYTGVDLPFAGFAMDGGSDMFVDYYHTTVDNGCVNEAGSALSPSGVACTSCPPAPGAVANDCSDQGSIAGTVWGDTESTPDGVDNNSTPLAGVTVTLYDAGGVPIATVVTDASGNYFFGGLTYGQSYSVGFGTPTGYVGPTFQDDPDATTATDSDINASAQTGLITICPACAEGTIDAADSATGAAHYQQVDAGFATVIVPVELISFNAEANGCSTTLSWSTATESNNSHFEILRSFDGNRFVAIGRVAGAGNSSEVQNYTFVDGNAQFRTYYKIKQVDFDGGFDFSQALSVQLDDCDRSKTILSTTPNPTKGTTFVQIALPRDTNVNISILDILGKQVKTGTYGLSRGLNSVELSLEELGNGTYIIMIQDDNGSILDTEKLIKI